MLRYYVIELKDMMRPFLEKKADSFDILRTTQIAGGGRIQKAKLNEMFLSMTLNHYMRWTSCF
jgi:hypothetical protein